MEIFQEGGRKEVVGGERNKDKNKICNNTNKRNPRPKIAPASPLHGRDAAGGREGGFSVVVKPNLVLSGVPPS